MLQRILSRVIDRFRSGFVLRGFRREPLSRNEVTPALIMTPAPEPEPIPIPLEQNLPAIAVPETMAEEPPVEDKMQAAPEYQPDLRELTEVLEDCVSLFDEIDGQIPLLDPSAEEIARHVCDRLQEILERAGMTVIAEDAKFDRRFHKPEKKTAGVTGGDTRWHAQILSPGFQLNRRVYRRARVRLTSIEDD